MLHYRSEDSYRHESRSVLLRSDVLRAHVFWREEMAGVE